MRLRSPSGSLSQFTQNKNGRTYPSIDGDRDQDNPSHWFWVYTYKLPDGLTVLPLIVKKSHKKFGLLSAIFL
jgi:hypothetical protein